MQDRQVMRRFVGACAKLPSMEALARQLELQHPCATRISEIHSKHCVGLAYFLPAAVHNWKVFWYSLPATTRRERLLKTQQDSLEQHRHQGRLQEQWPMDSIVWEVPRAMPPSSH